MPRRFSSYKLFFIVLLLFGCSKDLPHEGKVIFTRLPVESVSGDRINSIENKYATNMEIAMAFMGEKPEHTEVLTRDFISARAPELSFDGSLLVFSGLKNEEGAWQIWTMDLKSGEIVQVTDSRTNCTDPAWLPNGDITFSKMVTDDHSLKYHALFTIGVDGCCEQRITFQPHEDINASVLHDGRILVASKQVYPESGPYKYLALRPDGTKAEVFHLAHATSGMMDKAFENNEKVFFHEADELTSVKFNRPLHSRERLLTGGQIQVNSIRSFDEQNLLLSLKKPDEKTFGLALLSVEDFSREKSYFSDPEYHILEATEVRERSVPRKLPSRVNSDMSSGYLFSMNADASDIEIEGKTAKVRVLGMNGIIGETAVEEDGSFYLELTSDLPVRFQTVDASGEILRGPSSWMWVRPDERRGCAGCHQDREIAPYNVVPKALESAPFVMIR
ncbi:MAG: hypothetical protein MI975_03820 [Cytophagales bacterium]|nr:hypothetical protein [Cytophagales bacterium]